MSSRYLSITRSSKRPLFKRRSRRRWSSIFPKRSSICWPTWPRNNSDPQPSRTSTTCWLHWDIDMSRFDQNDVIIEHAKLVGGGGYLRLTHRPSGLFVDADLKSQPVI